MTATTIDNNALTATLRTLKLPGMLQTLDARLAQARAGELGHLEFLQVQTAALERTDRRSSDFVLCQNPLVFLRTSFSDEGGRLGWTRIVA